MEVRRFANGVENHSLRRKQRLAIAVTSAPISATKNVFENVNATEK